NYGTSRTRAPSHAFGSAGQCATTQGTSGHGSTRKRTGPGLRIRRQNCLDLRPMTSILAEQGIDGVQETILPPPERKELWQALHEKQTGDGLSSLWPETASGRASDWARRRSGSRKRLRLKWSISSPRPPLGMPSIM